MRFTTAALALAGLAESTTVYMFRYTGDIWTPERKPASVRMDPASAVTGVTAKKVTTHYTMGDDGSEIAWDDAHVVVNENDDGILAMSPKSVFMAAFPIVTMNPSKREMTVGAYDARPDCVNGNMVFAPQPAGADFWTLPLEWTDKFGSRTVEFQLSGDEKTFIVPEDIHRQYSAFFEEEAKKNPHYTTEDAQRDVESIKLSMEGVEYAIAPEAFVATGPVTTFTVSDSRGPTISASILNNLVVQLDNVSHRVGVCVPQPSLELHDLTLKAFTAEGGFADFNLDLTAEFSTVRLADASERYTLGKAFTWTLGPVLLRAGVPKSILALSPKSSFFATHNVVTLDQARNRMVVGEYDAAPACREGAMTFTAQPEGADHWAVSLSREELKHRVVQLDMATKRVGVCTAL